MTNGNGGKAPTFFWVGAIVMTALVTALIGVGAWLAWDQRHEASMLCERTVSSRDDNRLMWLWLIDAVSGTSDLAEPALVELNKNLPALECVDDHPVPRGGDGTD